MQQEDTPRLCFVFCEIAHVMSIFFHVFSVSIMWYEMLVSKSEQFTYCDSTYFELFYFYFNISTWHCIFLWFCVIVQYFYFQDIMHLLCNSEILNFVSVLIFDVPRYNYKSLIQISKFHTDRIHSTKQTNLCKSIQNIFCWEKNIYFIVNKNVKSWFSYNVENEKNSHKIQYIINLFIIKKLFLINKY